MNNTKIHIPPKHAACPTQWRTKLERMPSTCIVRPSLFVSAPPMPTVTRTQRADLGVSFSPNAGLKRYQGGSNDPIAWGPENATARKPLIHQRFQRLSRHSSLGWLGLLGLRQELRQISGCNAAMALVALLGDTMVGKTREGWEGCCCVVNVLTDYVSMFAGGGSH